MKPLERRILENVFDALDRLFDHNCQVEDVHDLLFASNIALKDLGSSVCLNDYVNSLESIIKTNDSNELKRELSLEETDKLRFILNDLQI